MGFESGDEARKLREARKLSEARKLGEARELSRELREAQAQTAAWGKFASSARLEGWWEWSEGWRIRWPHAKTAVLEAEKEMEQFAVSWAEAWARAEARAWREAMLAVGLVSRWGRVEGRWGAAGALLVAEALGEARAQARGERVPARLADPQTIANILTAYNRTGIARDFWDDSLERRDDYWCIIQFITPITRLPIELLHQIFLLIIEETSGPPLVLMLVCKQWHSIITSIWASLNLGTTTSRYAVESTQWLLDIVVDTDSDRGDFIPSGGAFEAIFAAIQATPRWRSFIIESFPAQADLPEDLVNRHLQQHSNAIMSRFTTFKIKSTCETSPLLHRLLHILGTTAGPALTTVEINSPNVISFLTPTYSSFFHSLKVLSLDAPGMHDPVDLLPHLYQLEIFTVSHLSFPTYPNHIALPFVHSLRHLSLRAASIQWMSGQIFQALEYCTLIFPRHQHVLRTFRTTLPNCDQLTFQGYPLKILSGFSAHKLSRLSVTCSSSFDRRGSRQLIWFSRQVLGERRLAPKSLHIRIEATNQAWMSSLVFMSHLEELVIHSVQPSSLGATFFQSLCLHPVHTSNMGMTSPPGELGTPFCPSLRRFGLKYDRWLQPTEEFDLIVLMSFILSRKHSKYALESFYLWTTSGQKDPLELIDRSQIRVEAFRRLFEESETTNFQVTCLMPKIKGDRHYYHKRVTCQISLNRDMRYRGVILAPALPNETQLVLQCRAECRSCSSATLTTSPQRCSPAAFDLEPVPDPKSDRPFELKLQEDKSNGLLVADVTFLIRHRPRVPKHGDQEWGCLSESLM